MSNYKSREFYEKMFIAYIDVVALKMVLVAMLLQLMILCGD